MLKPTKSASKTLNRLPHIRGLVLEGGRRPLGVFLREDKETVQPQVVLWVDARQDFVRSMAIITPDSTQDNGLSETLAALQTAFTGPFMPAPPGLNAGPGLPEMVRVDDEQLAIAARALLEPLGVKVEVSTELPAFEEVYREMSRGIGADVNAEPPQPFDWDINQPLLTALYRAADAYAKQAPWNYMPDNPPVEIRLGERGPQANVRTIYASILGGAGMVQGVAFYNSLADYYDLIEMSNLSEEQAGENEADGDNNNDDEELDLEQELALLQQMGAPLDRMSRQEALEMLAELHDVEKGAALLPDLKDCLTLWLEERDELDPTYLEWLNKRGLKYSKRQSIPVFNRVLSGGETREPDAREAEALRLALEGLSQFFHKHVKHLKSGMIPLEGLRLSVRIGEEGTPIELKYPASHYDEAHFEELARQGAASGKGFNIYELVFDHSSGNYLEDKAQRYQEQLLALFWKSSEGRHISKRERENGGWVEPLLSLGLNYLGVTPAQMTPAQFREFLYEVFPGKVTVSASEAPRIIRELRLFWQFLEREFSLPNAEGCLKILNGKAAERLEAELDDPANFGIAKTFLLQGLERGFDMSSQAGIEGWMSTYNSEMTGLIGGEAGRLKPLPANDNRKKESHTHKSGGRKKRR